MVLGHRGDRSGGGDILLQGVLVQRHSTPSHSGKSGVPISVHPLTHPLPGMWPP